jgi:hypothetical protein
VAKWYNSTGVADILHQFCCVGLLACTLEERPEGVPVD